MTGSKFLKVNIQIDFGENEGYSDIGTVSHINKDNTNYGNTALSQKNINDIEKIISNIKGVNKND